MKKVSAFLQALLAGSSNKAVVVAAASLLNAAESGNWTSVQSTVGYVTTVLVWLIPNVVKAVDSSAVPPKG